MSDLRDILKEEYEKNLAEIMDPNALMIMIEEALARTGEEDAVPESPLNEAERFSMHIPIPKLNPNEAWGNPDSQSRKDIDRIFASITREPSVQARIAHVNSFVDPALAKKKGTGMRFNAILNMMMIIEALQACLNDYSESASGFVFEGFMAAVTGGKQISGRVGGTLPIEDFVTGDEEPVSLKLLSPNTPIHGSFTNLVDFLFIRGGSGVPSIKYLIGRKNSDGDDVSELAIWDFIISRENFMAVMIESKNETKLLGKMAEPLAQHIAAWQDSPEWRLQMFEILKETPGYTKGKGMFYKNLDDAGTFDDKAGAPADPAKKQRQFATRKVKGGEGLWAQQQAREDAAAGTSNFAGFVAKYGLQNAEEKDLKTLEKIYNQEIAARASQLSESYFGSFHEREKRLMDEERVLMESSKEGGSQWSISAKEMESLDQTATVVYYGTLNMSTKNIKACADIYIKKMGKDMMELLETTKDFTENIGKYFSSDRRSTAMNANQKAQEEGKEVVKLLAADPATTETEV
tara:strand:+ start:53 stop:1612 length:1560 start_codon:yes stop_codon:yes gene_type:complete